MTSKENRIAHLCIDPLRALAGIPADFRIAEQQVLFAENTHGRSFPAQWRCTIIIRVAICILAADGAIRVFKRNNFPLCLPVFRDALRPIHKKLDMRILPDTGSANGKTCNIESLIIDHLDRVAADTKRLIADLEWFGHVIADIELDSDSGEDELLRAVAGLESRLDRILKNRDELNRWAVDQDDDDNTCLHMSMVYDSILFQMSDTLRDWLKFLDDPEPAFKTRQSNGSVQISGNVIQLKVDLYAPYPLEELLEWVKRRALVGAVPYERTMAFVENYECLGYVAKRPDDENRYARAGEDRDDCLPLLVGIAFGWMIGSG